MNYRPLRVQNLIRDELAEIIMRELEFPAVLTITAVEVDQDMQRARVFVSVFPQDKTDETLAILREAQARLQRILLRKINIKPMPRIWFELDRGPERAAGVEKLLLKEEDK